MTPKLFSIIASVTCLTVSCSTDSKSQLTQRYFFDSTAYPKQPFSDVALFVLESSQKTEIYTDSGTVYDKNVVEYVGDAGYSFIDSVGEPKTPNIKSYQLDSSQILKLENFLVQQPCTSDMVLDKNCAPVYKNVFVFYDKDKKAIAQLHVCFQCEMTTFKPYKEYMCDFDNKVDFKALKIFVDNIKNVSKVSQ